MKMFRIRKGDNVMVIAGKDADKDVPRNMPDSLVALLKKRCQFIFQMSWSYVLHVINQRELDTGI